MGIVWYSLRFKIKVTFGEFLHKLRQTNWNVARNIVSVVVDELPSQRTVYTCSTIDILDSMASTHINVVLCTLVSSAQNGGLPMKWAPEVFNFTIGTPSLPEST